MMDVHLIKNVICGALIFGCFHLVADLTDVQINKIPSIPYNSNVKVEVSADCPMQKDDPLITKAKCHPLGVDNYNDNFAKMRINRDGSTILVIINGKYRTYVRKIDDNPLLENKVHLTKCYHTQLAREITKELTRGEIVITVIALNAYQETIKTPQAMQTRIVHYRKMESQNKALDQTLSKPYILFNEPRGEFHSGNPILLDFIPMNIDISPRGYNVKVYIDDYPIKKLTSWSPYAITGLPEGSHVVRIVLIDPNGAVVPNPFSEQEKTIHVRLKGRS